jgi:8-oxo-dGTP diphosphatase
MEKKITIGNVCFIRDRKNNKILLLKRAREPMQNMYTGVGGKTGFDEDIYASCIREAKEETGLIISDVKLKGVIKTVLDGKDSSWILFVYLADKFGGTQIPCNEGELTWVPIDEIYSCNLIGFIRRTLPHVLDDAAFVEGTIKHDIKGEIIDEHLKVTRP